MSEFLEWRARGIGASDIAGILGVSPWNSRYSVWLSKVFDANAGEASNAEAMKWGKLLEDAVISEAARRLGVRAYGLQTRCEHEAYPWARCTVDAFCEDERGEGGVIEAKTTGENHWSDLPEYYEAQVLWQLEVTGRSYGWVAALHNGRKMSLWRVDARPDLQDGLIDAARYFWERFVLTGAPPPLDGAEATTDALNTLYGESDAGTTVPLDAYADKIAALYRLEHDVKTLSKDADKLKNEIKAVLGRGEVGTLDGMPAVSWKSYRARRIDLDALRAKYPREAADCETVSESRRFTLKNPSANRRHELASELSR